jgi:hypothetical protein
MRAELSDIERYAPRMTKIEANKETEISAAMTRRWHVKACAAGSVDFEASSTGVCPSDDTLGMDNGGQEH